MMPLDVTMMVTVRTASITILNPLNGCGPSRRSNRHDTENC